MCNVLSYQRRESEAFMWCSREPLYMSTVLFFFFFFWLGLSRANHGLVDLSNHLRNHLRGFVFVWLSSRRDSILIRQLHKQTLGWPLLSNLSISPSEQSCPIAFTRFPPHPTSGTRKGVFCVLEIVSSDRKTFNLRWMLPSLYVLTEAAIFSVGNDALHKQIFSECEWTVFLTDSSRWIVGNEVPSNSARRDEREFRV